MPESDPEVVRIGVGTGSPEGANSAYFLPAHATVIDSGLPTDAPLLPLLDWPRH